MRVNVWATVLSAVAAVGLALLVPPPPPLPSSSPPISATAAPGGLVCGASAPCECKRIQWRTYVVCSRVTDVGSLGAAVGSWVDPLTAELPWVRVVNSSIAALGERAFGQLSAQSLQINASNLSSIAPDAFVGLEGLTVLTLQDNALRAVPTAALHPFRRKLELLSLAGNLIESVDAGALSDLAALHYLSLSENRIGRIDQDALPPGLIHLAVGRNRLDDLGPFVHRLHKLEWLMVSHNNLTELAGDDLQHLGSLRLLLANHNRVADAAFAFERLPHLHTVHLKHNRLTTLDNVFANATALLKASVAHNGVRELGADAFADAANLRELDLAHNHVAHVDPLAFRGCPHLSDLSLAANELTVFPAAALATLHQLVFLDLSRNRITHLEGIKGIHLRALKILHLMGNQLTTLPATLLQHTPALLELGVSYNSLSTFDRHTFSHHLLRRLRIEGNPLQCTERLLRMLDSMEGNGTMLDSRPNCSSQRHSTHPNDVE